MTTYVMLALLALVLFISMTFAAKALPNLKNVLYNRGSLFGADSETVTCPNCKKTFKRSGSNTQTCPHCYRSF
ncbi:MAG: hypothetical protein LPJ96_08140 [Exiguobacterium sp.]|uniref:hypothetical protein n=1 Tax=unclassified Exiguobacterium TaxID=2644629 RepID=UPI0004A94E5F|nr:MULTISPECIES: hypothetical protein [unclassified Exiguobacterium]KDN57961.1 hypothetical protein DI14_02780 [Exiguobacterium sp. AB2]MDX5323566.1 hypothetical protein [Exiguobacterium sp.]MDX5425365.1 hypothetical protein [Exiguobacterium sp.]MDX6772783.1 hypothetical protein [Exiguobacterium sp.]